MLRSTMRAGALLGVGMVAGACKSEASVEERSTPVVAAATRTVPTAAAAPGASAVLASASTAPAASVRPDTSAAPEASAAPAPSSLARLEGEIELVAKPGPKAEAAEALPPITLLVKGSQMRFALPDGAHVGPISAGWGLVSAKDGKVALVIDARKQVIELGLDDFATGMDQMTGSAPAKAAQSKVSRTGRRHTVAGHGCEDWEITSSADRLTICVSEQRAPWLPVVSGELAARHPWLGRLLDGRHVPLRFVTYAKDGTEAGRLEVSRITSKSLPTSMFEIPAGYEVVSLEQLMTAAGAMMGGGAASGTQLPPDVQKQPGSADE